MGTDHQTPSASAPTDPAAGASAAPWILASASAAATRRAAGILGRLLAGGEVLGLVGSLGTGKTCFVQGLAAGLEVPPEAYVCSPTFALVNQHRGRAPLFHVDLYRLGDADEAAFIGYEDLFDGEAVVAIEWFERFPELWPGAYLRLDFAEASAGSVPGEASGPDPVVVAPSPAEADPAAAPEDEEGEEDDGDDEASYSRALRRVRVTAVGARYEALSRRWREALTGLGTVG